MTRSPLSGCLRNGNRNLQRTVADRQSNFQARSFNRSDISPLESTTCSLDSAGRTRIVSHPSMSCDHLRAFSSIAADGPIDGGFERRGLFISIVLRRGGRCDDLSSAESKLREATTRPRRAGDSTRSSAAAISSSGRRSAISNPAYPATSASLIVRAASALSAGVRLRLCAPRYGGQDVTCVLDFSPVQRRPARPSAQ